MALIAASTERASPSCPGRNGAPAPTPIQHAGHCSRPPAGRSRHRSYGVHSRCNQVSTAPGCDNGEATW
jgi:hypothetical protein